MNTNRIVFEPLDDVDYPTPVDVHPPNCRCSWKCRDDSEWWDPDLIHDGETQPRWEQAAGQVDFQLSYARSSETRVFNYAEIEGENIDDVRDPSHKNKSVGTWSIGDRPLYTKDDTVNTWHNIYTEAALQEGIHEVLEYLMVNNRGVWDFWMDPHGTYEAEIMEEVTRFAARLRAIREGKNPDG